MAQSSYRPDAIPVAKKQCQSMEGNSNPNHTNPNTNHNRWPGLILSSSTGAYELLFIPYAGCPNSTEKSSLEQDIEMTHGKLKL